MDKETVDKVKEELKCAYTKYSLIKIKFLEAEAEWLKKKKVFERYDYELALIDGRTKIMPPAGQKKVPVTKPVELSLDQILSVAARLGVSIDEASIPDDKEEAADVEEI